MTDNESGARGGLGTIRNASRLLELLAQGPAFHHLTELAQESGMSVPTVHRLLRSLTIAKLVSQDPTTARYGLGPELTRLSNHFVSRHPVATAFAPFAVSLRNQLNATVSIHILVDGEVVCIDQIDADDRGAFRSPGTTQPVTRSAPGRVLLSHAPMDHWSTVIESDPQISDTDRDVWARADFVHVLSQDMVHPAQVAVPIRDASGMVVASLCADVESAAEAAQIDRTGAALARTAMTCGRTIIHA